MPYISMIDTNGAVIVFVLMMVFAACVTNIAYLAISKAEAAYHWWGMAVAGSVGAALGYLGVWVLMGDSVWWSKPIGIWLKS